jgi:tRNA pseudouridine38-40 synthase
VIKLVLEYDGTGFAGWQEQPGQRTLQSELEAAIAKLTGESLRVTVAGRTDAGVHALAQVVSFRTESDHPAWVLVRGLNSNLPRDMTVLDAQEMPADFHARSWARGKTYRYLILDRQERPALRRERAWHIFKPLDLEPMRRAARALVGEHDFESFRSATCEMKSPVCDVRRIEVFRDAFDRVVIEIRARAFLKQMARTMVGTLVEVGQGKREAGEMEEILAARDRRRAGMTAPAHGLYLVRVDYDPVFKED